jgi:hypothetical protein
LKDIRGGEDRDKIFLRMAPAPRVGRRAAAATLAAAGIGLACRTSVEPDSRPMLDDIAGRYVRSALELAQHQPSLVELWLGPGDWRPGRRRPVADIRADVEKTRDVLGEISPSPAADTRVRYLRQQMDALLVAARRLTGESLRFADEARVALGSDVGAFIERLAARDADVMAPTETARARLEELLPGAAPLYDRYLAFRTRHAVPASRVGEALRAAVDLCRDRVNGRIDLPDAENVDVRADDAIGLEARAVYERDFRSRVLVDTSRPTDLVHLLWLAAHETYPGHHVQHVLGDRDVVSANGWRERALYPSFGRHLLCAEGAAEAGAALLFAERLHEEAVRDLAARLAISTDDPARLVAVHRAVIDLDVFIAVIARDYLDSEMSSESAVEQLQTRALVAEPWHLLSRIERQRTRVLAYPVGRRLVLQHLGDGALARRWERLAALSTTMVMA